LSQKSAADTFNVDD